MSIKHKVFAYITHEGRLLLLSHPHTPEAGLQVPAGTVEANEDWDTAVLREAAEETGLTDLVIDHYLGEVEFQWTSKDERVLRHFYHLRCAERPPERWWHDEIYPSEGDEAVIPFEFYWAQLPHEVPVLAPGHGYFLGELMAHLGTNLLPVGPAVPTSPAVFPEREVLDGRFVTLQPLDPTQHTAALYAISHGAAATENLWTYMGYGPFADEAAMQTWLAQQATSSDPLFFTAIDKATNQPVGMVSYLNIAPTYRRLEVGHIWYGPAAQRTNINTEAIYLMLQSAFNQWDYRRAEWKCDALNGRSRRAALRLGFQYEGLFRQHVIVKGRSRDTTWFAMMDHEWPRVKQNMERWLYDDEPRPLSWLNRQIAQ